MKVNRETIYQVAKENTMQEQEVNQLLHQNVYPEIKNWFSFLKTLMLGSGIVSLSAGIMFFFAFNWDDMHKFTKFGLVQGLVFIMLSVFLFSKNKLVKDITLTGATFVVGVMFALFGQIYQTGANAYDFFLGWTVFVTIWVVVSGFSVQWLFYVVLLNITLYFYQQQVLGARWWRGDATLGLFYLNIVLFVFFEVLSFIRAKVPQWFLTVLVTTVLCFATREMIEFIISSKEGHEIEFYLSLFGVVGLIVYAITKQKIHYVGLSGVSMIVTVVSSIIEFDDDEVGFLMSGFFVVVSVGILVKIIVELKKSWNDGK